MLSRKKLLGVIGGGAFALTLSFSLTAQADAATLNVALTGGTEASTRADALKPGYFFRTIKGAIDMAVPNDVVEVAPGNYEERVLIIYKNNLTVQAKPGIVKPRITAPGETYAIVRISASSYIKFLGFEVDGSNAGPNVAGVLIVPRTENDVVTTTHHITVGYNRVHDAGGGGIGTNPNDSRSPNPVGCDYISITGNEVYNCLKTGIFGGSAISILLDENYDNEPGYHTTIQNNRVYNNVINSNNTGLQTDGNGIIVDSNGLNGPKTLVQNNLVYRNGGRGFHVFSSNVDVLNNTCYKNCNAAGVFAVERDKQSVAEITAVSYINPDGIIRTRNVNIINNLCVSNANAPSYAAVNYSVYNKIPGTNTDDLTNWRIFPLEQSVFFAYNSYNSNAVPNRFILPYYINDEQITQITATNLFPITDPLFVNASLGNFRLNTNSLAIDRGTMFKYATGTFDGLIRLNIMGAGIDLGAYERAK